MPQVLYICPKTQKFAIANSVSEIAISNCLIAGCASYNLNGSKISIGQSTPKLTFDTARNISPWSVNSAYSWDRQVKALKNTFYAYTHVVVETEEEAAEHYANFGKDLTGSVIKQMKPIVGTTPGYGRIFYAAWNNVGDRKTLKPSKFKTALKALSKEGYKVKIQESRFHNVQHPERKLDQDSNLVMQITITYTGKPEA